MVESGTVMVPGAVIYGPAAVCHLTTRAHRQSVNRSTKLETQ